MTKIYYTELIGLKPDFFMNIKKNRREMQKYAYKLHKNH